MKYIYVLLLTIAVYLIGYNQGYMTEDPTLNLRDYNRGYATAMQYANTHMVYNSCDVE